MSEASIYVNNVQRYKLQDPVYLSPNVAVPKRLYAKRISE